MKEEIPMVPLEEFEERLEEYRKENSLADRVIQAVGGWENMQDHLVQDLFKRMNCKPIINKY